MNFADHRRAQACIAQGYLTNSKRPEALVKGVYPTHLDRGKGCFVWDTQNRKYLDFICGLGSSLFGYANGAINGVMLGAMQAGSSLSLATTYELSAAEKLKELFPFVDCVKFLKTGSEACSAAVRIARAKTGRDFVLSEAYHGWHDEFASLVPPAIGIPNRFGEPYSAKMNGLASRAIAEDCAAVIVEPIVTNLSPERIEWLKNLRETCTKHGVLLIFDEVITGFRFPKYSVSEHLGITPDLIVLGKAIANGMPLAAIGGKYDVMNCDEYFVSSTYAGETISLAAATYAMTLLQRGGDYDLDRLWHAGQIFLEQFNALWPEKLRIDGYPTRGVLTGDPMVRAIFMQEACRAGFLFGPSWFLSFPAIDEIRNIMPALTAIVERIRRGEAKLEGEAPRSPFAERVRQQ